VSNPVVLITGGLTGIGRAAAVAFAKKGAKVVVAGRRDEAGKALVKELGSLGSEAEFINADVRKDEDVRALVDKTIARFGRLDVAVNNAGTEGEGGPVTDQTAKSYAATFDTNVLGVILSMKHEVRVMKNRAAVTSSTSPRPTVTKARRVLLSMSPASTLSKASLSRWRSKSRSRGFA
jgi:NAD(P)-dependent dehydrogenase (short-subunit alcohol dehydrogenase family)